VRALRASVRPQGLVQVGHQRPSLSRPALHTSAALAAKGLGAANRLMVGGDTP
jgi:hypothetical protein